MSGSASGKKVSEQAVLGALGANLVERIVLSMGCAWHPTSQPLEAGIDGEIELVDPTSRNATNAVIRVQSKATIRRFTAETDDSFQYLCDQRDLRYWLSGNAPVILVVSRPHTDEAFWVSIKDYFKSAGAITDRRVTFDKQQMRFTKDSLGELWKVGVPASSGLYFAPPPRPETLFSNLLTVNRLPKRLWLADTAFRKRYDVASKLTADNAFPSEFILRNKRLLSPHDLGAPQWKGIVDQGTVEDFATSEWADSKDIDKQEDFAELLRYCLSVRSKELGIRIRRDDDALFFEPSKDNSPRVMTFQSVKELTERTVFQPYTIKKGEQTGQPLYYRHVACFANFHRHDGQWYLEIQPTYHYTSDGRLRHPQSHLFLSGMKRRERQLAVLYQVVMWGSILRGSDGGDAPFPPNLYPFLGFGPLLTFSSEIGIRDKDWLPNEELDSEDELSGMGGLPLFNDVDVPLDGIEEVGHES